MLKILLILQLPPPKHGASFAGECIRNSTRINREFQCEYVRISTVPERGGGWLKKLGTTIALYWRVWKLASQGNYDLVYMTPCASGLPFYKDYIVSAIVRHFGTRIVYHFHNKGILTNRFVPGIVKRRYFAGVSVILLSPRLYYDVQEYVPPSRVYYLPNGVDGSGIDLGLGTKSSVVTILFLSNMIRTKGVFVLLEACRILKKRGLSFLCNFAGPWYEIREAEFAAFVQTYKLAEFVRHVGPKYGSAKSAEFLQADVFAFPSYYPDECLPLVLLEAMSFGLPVVTTSEGAIPDIVDAGINGFLVEKRNPTALANALQVLIEQPAVRARMGASSREKFESRYTVQSFESGFITVMRSLVDAQNANPDCANSHNSGKPANRAGDTLVPP